MTDIAPMPTKSLTLGVAGMVEGNGHPYSWSAIVNGYDSKKIAESPYPIIAEYLNEQPEGEVGIPNVKVTHIWTDNPSDAEDVAEATHINEIVSKPADLIGEVDAVLIPTDDGDNHVNRIEPFTEAEMPIFVDKPLATNTEDLADFIRLRKKDVPLISSSAMRYDPAVKRLSNEIPELGNVEWMSNVTHKTWKRYGIHALEPIFRLLGPGFTGVDATVDGETGIYTCPHESGTTVSICASYEARGSFGRMTAYGTEETSSVVISDTYTSFRRQLEHFLTFVIEGHEPFPFEDTIELMAILIAGHWSQQRMEFVELTEIYDELPVSRWTS